MIYLGMMSALAPLATDMYLPALPEISSFFGISTSTTQMTLTMTLVGMAVGQVLGGPVSDRLGRKLPILLGMLGFLVSAVVCSVVQDIEVFLFFRLIMGLSGAFGIVISRAVARDTEEGPELMRFMALLMMVNGLAPILAPVLGAQILRFAEWHAVFVALSIVGILMILATLVFRETLHKDNRVRNVSDGFVAFGTLMKDRYFFGHCLLQCFIFGSFFSYIAGSSFLFQNIYHVSPQIFSYIFGGIGIGLMIAGIIPARMAGAVREIVLLKWAVLVPMAGSFFFPGRNYSGGADLVQHCCAFPDDYASFRYGGIVCISCTFPVRKKCRERLCTDRFLLHDPGRRHDACSGNCRRSDGSSHGADHVVLLHSGQYRSGNDDPSRAPS